MTSLIMDANVTARFNAICRAVQSRQRGMSLQQIGDAAQLARQIEAGTPDSEMAVFLRGRLGLEEAVTAEVASAGHRGDP